MLARPWFIAKGATNGNTNEPCKGFFMKFNLVWLMINPKYDL